MSEVQLQLAPGEASQIVLATPGGPISVWVPNTHPLAEKLLQLLKEAGPMILRPGPEKEI